MSITITINGDQATLNIEITGEKDKVLATADKAGKRLYGSSANPNDAIPDWDELTTQEKLNALESSLRKWLKSFALQQIKIDSLSGLDREQFI